MDYTALYPRRQNSFHSLQLKVINKSVKQKTKCIHEWAIIYFLKKGENAIT
jgi:hypothetical protein